MKKTLLALAAAVALTACGSQSEEPAAAPSAEQVNVVASHYPVQFLVDRIGGDAVQVESLTAPGAEPHDLELSPQQVADVQQAAAVFYIGEFQPAVDDAVAEADGTVVDLSTGLPLREGEEHAEEGEEHAEEGEEHADEHGGTDPHVWLDPVLMSQMATTVADTLSATDPDNQQSFEENAKQLQDELSALDGEWSSGTQNCEIRTMVVSHEAFGYLADRYGFEQKGISGLSPENEPSAEAIAQLAQFVQDKGVTTVYSEVLVDPAVAETVAAEAGAQTAVLDPLEGPPATGDYLSAMRENLDTVVTGQSCS